MDNYYILRPFSDPVYARRKQHDPNVMYFDYKNVDDGDLFSENEPVAIPAGRMALVRSGSKSAKPVLKDYHEAGAAECAFTERIVEILRPLDLFKVKYIPATVFYKHRGDKTADYFLMHNYNRVDCLCDEEEFTLATSRLSGEKLSKIPLPERLFFLIKGELIHLVHESIKDLLVSAACTGADFVPVEKDHA